MRAWASSTYFRAFCKMRAAMTRVAAPTVRREPTLTKSNASVILCAFLGQHLSGHRILSGTYNSGRRREQVRFARMVAFVRQHVGRSFSGIATSRSPAKFLIRRRAEECRDGVGSPPP